MDVQGIGEECESGGGLRLDLTGQLPLIVEISSSLDALPREIITISEQIKTETSGFMWSRWWV